MPINKRAAALFILIIVICSSACRMPRGLLENDGSPAPVPTGEGSTVSITLPSPDAALPTADSQAVPSVSKTIYYATDEGYLLPVAVSIPFEEGIARACLERLVNTPENANTLKAQALIPPIPNGTTFGLSISGGEAQVNLIGMPQLGSSREEQNVFAAVVNTLIEFSSVEMVSVFVNGMNIATKNGVYPPQKSGRIALNVESNEVPASGSAQPVTLYFPNGAASHFIPVTRYTERSGLARAVSELVSGTTLPGLVNCFPENTLLLGAAVENGLLTVNLSEDFKRVSETPEMYSLAMHAVLLTAMPYASIDEIRFTVNGELFEP